MRAVVFKRLGLSGGSTSEVSQAVSMDGFNAAEVDIVVLSLGGTGPTVTVQLQESNDLENWRDKGGTTTTSAAGYALCNAITAIGTAFVRVKITAGGTTPTAVVSAGISTSVQ